MSHSPYLDSFSILRNLSFQIKLLYIIRCKPYLALFLFLSSIGRELAKFQSEQALKSIQKLPCSTEQKLELVDAAVKHLKVQQ